MHVEVGSVEALVCTKDQLGRRKRTDCTNGRALDSRDVGIADTRDETAKMETKDPIFILKE